jgi:hypothetical protein
MYFGSFLGLFLGYVLVALGVTWFLVKLAGRLGAGWKLKTPLACLMIAAFALFPTWDIPLAEREFQRLCETEAGLKMIKSIDDVPGFMSDFLGGKGPAEEFLRRDGYEFFESRDVLNNMVHYSLDEQGRLVEQKVDKLAARYRIEKTHTFLDYVIKRERFIEDMQTKEKLATQVAIIWRGGWVAQWLLPPHGAYTCEPEQMPIEEFLTKTLKPSRRLHKGA